MLARVVGMPRGGAPWSYGFQPDSLCASRSRMCAWRNKRLVVPMIGREDYSDVGTVEPEDIRSSEPTFEPTRSYPAPLEAVAYRGLFGSLVAVLDPHTEADPTAILVQALAAFGSIIGRNAHFTADGARHHANLFAVLVAASSKGRKGTSWAHVRNCFNRIDETWRVVSGLASGEGLIWHVRDAHYREQEIRRN